MSIRELRTPHVAAHRHPPEASSDHPSRGTSRPSVSGAIFRSALSRLAAGTSIVTMCDQDGHKLGLTATAVTSVSLDPPLVLVCVDNRARTAAALKAHTPFVVHFLTADQESLAQRFASPNPNKFDGLAHHLTANGCPQLEDVLASVECVPYQLHPGGDHIIVIGRVVGVHVGGDDMLPLIYFRSQFLKRSITND
jgi:flavin reductase ActVB